MRFSQISQSCLLPVVFLPLVFAQPANPLYPTRFSNVTWNNADWQLETTNLDQGHYQSRIALSNGYLGSAVAALGPFFEIDVPVSGDNIGGWPLFARRQTFATIGGFWDSQERTNGTNFEWLLQYGGESVITGIPHWAGIILDLGHDAYLDASTSNRTVSGFRSMMDYKQGRMSWTFTWTPNQDVSFDVSFQMIIHKLHVNQAMVQMQVTPSVDCSATVANVLNGDCAVRSEFAEKGAADNMIYSAVRPYGINNVTGYVYAGMTVAGADYTPSTSDVASRPYAGNNESSIAQGVDVSLAAGHTATFTKFVGIASADAFQDPKATACDAVVSAMKSGFDAVLKSHVEEWAAIFHEDSVDSYNLEDGSLPDDEYIIESAVVAVVNPFYLLQNTVGQNALAAVNHNSLINQHSIAVGGLASDAYAGWIFWDAEIWMQPGLAAAFPQAAKGIADYRVATYPQALENPLTVYQSSKNQSTFSDNAAAYPWISGRYGNCTAAGPCFDYEYHLNGDIALEFETYWVVSGDTKFFEQELFPIYNSIAVFLSEILEKNADGEYELRNMTDPDEFANGVDNGGFTMPLIAETLQRANMFRSKFGLEPNSTWNTQASNVVISRNSEAGIILEYTGMNGSISVKQADVVLVTYPLSYEGMNYSQQNSLDDLDYYAAKQSQAGPGMTYAIFAIVASEVSPSGCSAYTYQQYSEQPYARAPWFQFSEQLLDNFQINGGFHPAFPFLTGHGGANQVVLFGYLGLRLIPDGYLHIDPTLPPQIPVLHYRTFYWQGWPIQAVSNHTTTTLTRLSTPLDTANSTFATEAIPIVLGLVSNSTSPVLFLPPHGTISIPNRTPADIKTVAGNLAQCQPVWSTDPVVPGQFAISAVDGAASTQWQPTRADLEASVTVQLPSGEEDVKVKAFYFDWAQAPPVSFRVDFHNGSSDASGSGNSGGASPASYDPNSAVEVASQNPVNVSMPYDEASVADVVPYTSNTTLLTLDTPVPVGGADGPRYATLRIRGNQGIVGEDKFNASEVGAEVAEWGIIVDDGMGNDRVDGRGIGQRGYNGQDLSGVVFNKKMVVRRDAAAAVVLEGEDITRRAVAVEEATHATRDAVLGKYGRYMRRPAGGEGWYAREMNIRA
jgi:trehalose/maltose hydrolase-like predicted phosphorylase